MSYDRARDRYRDATEPSDPTVERVWDRIQAPRTRRRPAVWVATALAVAAAAAVWVSASPGAPSLHQTLSSSSPVVSAPTEELQLIANGDGELTGTRQAPRLAWHAGELHVDLTPDRGIDLRVTAPYAEVKVVGTAFDVEVSGLGTTVRVARGRVEVTCEAAAPQPLGSGQAVTCLPTNAPGLLLRATTQLNENIDPNVVLDTVTTALSAPAATPAVRRELQVMHIELLGRVSRYADAARAARTFLAGEPGPHAPTVRAYLQQLEAAGY